MGRVWKSIATILGLALTVATGSIALLEYRRTQPNLKVYPSSVELERKPVDRESLLADLRWLEDEYSALTGMLLLDLLDSVENQEPTAEGEDLLQTSQPNAPSFEDSLKDEISEARDLLLSDIESREAQVRALAEALANLVPRIVQPDEGLLQALGELEQQYVAYSGHHLVTLIVEVSEHELDPTAVEELLMKTVNTFTDMADSLLKDRNQMSSALQAIVDGLSNDKATRLYVQVKLENHSQLPTTVRSEGVIGMVFGKGKSTHNFQIKSESDGEIEGFSVQEMEFRSDVLDPKAEQPVMESGLKTRECVIGVQDLGGKVWLSQMAKCVGPRVDGETDKPVDILRAAVKAAFEQ